MLDQIHSRHGVIVNALLRILRVISIGSKDQTGDGAFVGGFRNQRLGLFLGQILLDPLHRQTFPEEVIRHCICVRIFFAQHQNNAEAWDHTFTLGDAVAHHTVNLKTADGSGIGQIQIVNDGIGNTRSRWGNGCRRRERRLFQ